MNIFDIHSSIISSYKSYISSFLDIKDKGIRDYVSEVINRNELWPEPLIQFNPAYAGGGNVEKLVKEGKLAKEFQDMFVDEQGQSWNLYQHQAEAIEKGIREESFVVTSGTGSGKSLTYITPIIHHCITQPGPGVKAVIVYPMNALINSQHAALESFLGNYMKRKGEALDVRFAQYTGQEKEDVRDLIISNPPQILLTNYMMLELIMVRNKDEQLRNAILNNLRFLVFDELHTYKGRQGADVSMLIRRIKSGCSNPKLICIGTSATMVSTGDRESQKTVVAQVASRFFNTNIQSFQVVHESLEFATSEIIPDRKELAQSIQANIPEKSDRTVLMNHPLARWIEQRFAITDQGMRGDPATLSQISQQLSIESGVDDPTCRRKIIQLLMWAEKVNIEIARLKRKDTILPFRLHQFISQTGYVYSTLGAPEDRYLTVDPNPTVKLGGLELPLFPIVFSRYSGHEYYCVRKFFSVDQSKKLVPREFGEVTTIPEEELETNDGRTKQKRLPNEQDYPDGYLVFDPAMEFWNEDEKQSLPETWFKKRKAGPVLDQEKEIRLPQLITFDQEGNFSNEDKFSLKAWFIPAPLLIDITCGVIYERLGSAKESTKLMALGNEGRSTSTTILSLATLLAMEEAKVDLRQQKMMSFIDNRQDASLQTGHFNDFYQVVQLRSALHKAVASAPEPLQVHALSFEVEKQLKLTEDQYARNPSDPAWPNEENRKALRNLLLYRLLKDLGRGWRFIFPNLEQTGLLEISYSRLDEFVKVEQLWQQVPLFNTITPDDRYEFLLQTLNYFRTNYALDHEILRFERRQVLKEELRDRLDVNKLWSLDKNEEIEAPNYLTIGKLERGSREVFTRSVGPASRLAKYFRNIFRQRGMIAPKGDEYNAFITSLLNTLCTGNFLRKEQLFGRNGNLDGYQLIVGNILWKTGNGNIIPDHTTYLLTKELESKPNEFFRNLYSYDYSKLRKYFYSREHTGQITEAEVRQDREKKFDEGAISLLYCSPTMELGIDISSLNFVHLRNIPPNPSNYAQRSGRAGRSGQSAMIMAYCSRVSPHDRHYFKNKLQMVSGEVQPPRIDLTNEELIRSHLHAYVMGYLNAEEFRISVIDLLDPSDGQYNLRQSLKDRYNLVIQNQFVPIRQGFSRVIHGIPLNETYWFSENWLDEKIRSFTSSLESALLRWRKLYLRFADQQAMANQEVNNPILKEDAKKLARFKRSTAEKQMAQLRNDSDGKNNSRTLSEFYVFRYLASEGFLPGYNFTRLPLRVFLGGRESGIYISRPRFTAIKEFGPNNIIYHNGGKYRINRMELTDVEFRPRHLTVFKGTGYAYWDEESKGINQDPINGTAMNGATIDSFTNVLELGETQAESVERISCMEEVRVSEGFKIDLYVNSMDGFRNTPRINLFVDDQKLMELIYSPATNMIEVNQRWRKSRSSSEGFWIGQKSGFIKTQKETENPNPDDPPHCVRFYTQDNADILYVQPIRTLGLSRDGIITLQYALEKAIEQVYKIEPNEIESRLMGEGDNPNILIYESAEGSLGILKELHNNTSRLKEVFKEAYHICGFDPITLEDMHPEWPKASYDNLLSYYNQRDHQIIDRNLVKAALELLMSCEPDNTGNGTYKERFDSLAKGLNPKSEGERILLEHLYSNGLRLPEHTNYNMEQFYVQPDFVYSSEPQALVFVDGGIHKNALVRADDERKRLVLKNAGYDVLVWVTGDEPVSSFVSKRKDIFRKVR